MINELNISKAYREVILFIDVLPEKYKQKLPPEILQTLEQNQDKDYHPEWEGTINANSNARDLNLLHETIALIAWLNLEFWEESEEEKARLMAIYKNNNTKNMWDCILDKTMDCYDAGEPEV